MTPSGLLESNADEDVLRLVQGRESGTDDDRTRVDVLNLVAWFHDCRANATGQPPHLRDHRIAFHFFGGTRLGTHHPVPDGLRPLLGLPPAEWRLDNLALALVQVMNADDPAALDAMVDRFATPRTVGPGDPASRTCSAFAARRCAPGSSAKGARRTSRCPCGRRARRRRGTQRTMRTCMLSCMDRPARVIPQGATEQRPKVFSYAAGAGMTLSLILATARCRSARPVGGHTDQK